MKRARRSGLVLAVASAASVVTALSGIALASPAGGVKGDPQPELKPFSIGPSNTAGTVAIEPDGGLVLAYDISAGNGKTLVCLLNRGASKCSDKIVLNPLDGDDTFGPPQVYVTSANHVIVLQETCCDSNSSGGDLIYSSTDGGHTFSAPVRVGTLDVGTSALVGNNLLFTTGDDGAGAQVESIAVKPAIAASGPVANPNTKEAFDSGVSDYHGGALVASDSGDHGYTTYAEYAPSGDNPGTTSSYHSVGTFPGEQMLAISGRALLTLQTGGKEWARVRLFNGTSFGPAHNVPGSSGGGPEWFTIDQDPSGAVHVFSDRGLAGALIYDLIERTTSNGSNWSGPVNLGDTLAPGDGNNQFFAGLDSHGSGIVLGTGPAWGYPVLATQSVTFNLKASSIRKGRSATGSGKGSPAATGRRITLQVQGAGGKWFNVATTHEKSGGSFSFTIKGKSAGTFRYRAVAADLAGYLQYGYSNAKSLKVTG